MLNGFGFKYHKVYHIVGDKESSSVTSDDVLHAGTAASDDTKYVTMRLIDVDWL